MSNLLENLNEQQLKAVTHVDGPLLIVAGAGTGKTTVITRRIAYLIEQKLARPEQVLALTFTDKAAGEMEERVDQLVPLGVHDFWISTFHSFCERIIKQHGIDIGLSNDFQLLDQTRQWIFVYKHFSEFKLDYYRPLGSPNKFIDSLLDHFSKCKDELVTPEDYLAYAESLKLSSGDAQLPIGTDDDSIAEIKRVEELANAYHTYQKLMLDNEYMDFGDLIHYCIQLLQRRPNLLKFYQQQFKFVMVDEFQDTNVAQYELIKLLTTSKNPDAQVPNLVVVGDDDQSIYKFRGASVSNILKIKEDFPTIENITLVDNYRSSQDILDLAYNFIQHNNPNRLETKMKIDKRLKGHTKEASEIQVLEGKDLSEELNLVVTKALELKQQFPDSTWNDFCILTRSNSGASEIIPVLEAKQVPYSFVANRGLYKKPLIADLINYLKLLDNYHESQAMYRVLNFPKFQLDAIDVAHITQFTNRKTISVYEAMQNDEALAQLSETSKTKIALLLELLKKHSAESTDKSAVELFVELISDLGIDSLLAEDTLENAQNRELLEQFYKKVETYAQEAEDRTMRGFLNELNLEFKAGEDGAIKFDPNSGPESLKVMTIHSAKGLEFKFAFLINLVDQRFPTRAQRDAIELPTALVKDILPEGDFHLQEERRLFYVALTRAKTHLYLTWGLDYGGAKYKKPSIFLTETNMVPSDNITKATGKVVFAPPKGKPRKVVYKILPENFSFSQISTFLQCPQEYKYRYYLRLPIPGNHHLSFGSTIHTVLQKYMEEYLRRTSAPQQDLFTKEAVVELPPESLLLELYEKEWLDDWYETKEQKEKYRARGVQILHSFYERTSNLAKSKDPAVKLAPKLIEESFSLKLGASDQYTFNGKIDRADSGEKGLQIIDYKTSEKVPSKTAGGDVDQLRIYQWAADEYFHEPVENLQYWYLYPNETVAVPLAKPEQIQELKDKLLATIEEIRDAVKYDKFALLHKKSKRHNCNYEDLK
ncbi:MAG TPA: UvrD-helicase domain-containing protein [Patescibacteria group bacterium]|jgi:DNA helicase-2/ATP-dependent DNA helicase PcrA|nr:UvrD-helicase domain-containing protein [Patescibacteria group bacterium]